LNKIIKFCFLPVVVLLIVTSLSCAAEPSENNKVDEDKVEKNESPTVSSLWGDLKQAASSASDSVSSMGSEFSRDAIESYDEAAQYSESMFDDFMLGLDANIIALEKMGYVVTDLYIGIGLIPSVSFKISKIKEVPLEEQKAILKESGNNSVLSYAMDKLNKAYSMKMGEYQIKAVRMDLSLPPRTSVHFIKLNGDIE